MPRGGYRPGAGRKKRPVRIDTSSIPRDVKADAKKAGMSPLDYMLAVVRNPEADQSRRDRMAVAAAPYCHPRVSDTGKVGKKETQAAAAETAGQGSEWAGDLDEFDGSRPN